MVDRRKPAASVGHELAPDALEVFGAVHQAAGAVGRRLLDFLGLPQQGIHADLGQSSIVHFVYLVS